MALAVSTAAIAVSLAAVAPGTAAAADPAPSTSFVPGGAYVAVAPARVLDTRTGLGAVRGATKSVRLQVAGAAGVPPVGAAAVVLNVTVTAPVASGFLSVSPTGTTSTSSVNFHAGQTVAQLVTSKLGSGGGVELRSIATTQVVADVVGWFTDRDHAAGRATFHPIANRRALDTRGSGGPLANGARRIALAGVPAGTVAAVVDVTAVRPTSAVYVTAWGAGTRPSTSTLNAARGEVRSNRALVPVAPDGSISVYSNGRTDVVVDVNGWFSTSAAGAYFVPTEPVRIADSRSALNVLDGSQPGQVIKEFGVAGQQELPPTTSIFRPVAAWLTTTVTTRIWHGWVGFGPTTAASLYDQPTATTSDINFDQGATANAVIAALGDGGWVTTTGRVGAPVPDATEKVDLAVDAMGVFVGAVPQPQIGTFVLGGESGTSSTRHLLWDRPLPDVGGDVAQVSASEDEEVVRYHDGTVRWWNGTAAPAVLDHDAVDIAGSVGGVYVVRSDGSVWTDDFWSGMHGTAGSSGAYGQVPGVTGAVSVSAGDEGGGAFAVRRDGSVVTWGRDHGVSATPIPSFGTGVIAIAATGGDGACAAYADGGVGFDPGPYFDPDSGDHVTVLHGVGAVQVAISANGSCMAVDGQHRLHELTFPYDDNDPAPTDTVIDGPPVAEALGHFIGWSQLGVNGYVDSSIRILGLDGHVYDRGWDGAWNVLGGFSGVAAIGGRLPTVIWVPPAG